jgi:peptidoglycan LD-endopeptidase CwlK
MTFALSERSRSRLEGVHPDLVKVVSLAITKTPVDFGITEGLRDRDRQAALVAKGASKTMNSRHLTGHAIDFVCWVEGEVSWELAYYKVVADAFKSAAAELGIPIVWGGDWKGFVDGPHIELDRKVYP